MSRVLPILFNTDMVRAILDGRKTVTRRICKDANDYTVPDMSFYDADRRTYAVHNYADKDHTDKLSLVERTCPICPGDILYVRETWNETTHGYNYKASPLGNSRDTYPWRPSIHMPKEAARIWLKVTSVRVERLQEITEEQAIKEGMPEEPLIDGGIKLPAVWDFMDVWNSTIKKSDLDRYGWDANPWVWAIEFEQCEKPEEIYEIDKSFQQQAKELMQYRAIGTVEECRVARDKQAARKRNRENGFWPCPNCGEPTADDLNAVYCSSCGQKLEMV